MVCEPVTLGAAVLAGLAGSGHCLAMCGGLSSAFALRVSGVVPASGTSRRPASAPAAQLAWLHLGRLTSYVLAGALAGGLAALGGDAASALIDLRHMATLARVASGLMILAVAVTLLTRFRPLRSLERLGARLWQHLAPLGRHLPERGWLRATLLGMLWGWMPCGFVYTLLLFAALRGNVLASALTLAAFGVGTLPMLLGSSLLATRWPRTLRGPLMPRLAGWALLGCGAWTLLGVLLPHHH